MSASLYAGVDFGGTAARLVITADGTPLAESTRLTNELAAGTPAERIDRVASWIEATTPTARWIEGVGIGATGPVDPHTGEIHNPATLPAFSGIGLMTQLRVRLGVPVVIDNDAVVAALGEYHHGAGAGAARLVMVTLGTGIGAALLDHGEPFRVKGGAHPEVGHIPVFGTGPSCYCGLRGCWEPQASRTAFQALLRPVLPSDIASRDLLKVAADRHEADSRVQDAFRCYGRAVGRGLACIQTMYGPDRIIVGGAAGLYLDLLAAGIERELTQEELYTPRAQITSAALGELAGALGAAALARAAGMARPSS